MGVASSGGLPHTPEVRLSFEGDYLSRATIYCVITVHTRKLSAAYEIVFLYFFGIKIKVSIYIQHVFSGDKNVLEANIESDSKNVKAKKEKKRKGGRGRNILCDVICCSPI